MFRFHRAAVLTAVLATGPVLGAQGGRDPVPEVDPYTENDPKVLERAGYVSFGPFRFGEDHTTLQVHEVLGGVPLLWVETEHFLFGSSLDKVPYPSERDDRKALDRELARLREKIPGIQRRVREIDPWLRLHLYAQRLEDLYSRFCEVFDIEEDELPAGKGKGRYLGLPSKFSVLLCEKESSFGRYTQTYFNYRGQGSYRYFNPEFNNLFFGTAAEFQEGGYGTDIGLHCAVAWNLAKNFANAAFGHDYDLPFFWTEGLAHWFSRDVDTRFPFFTAQNNDKLLRNRSEKDWPPRIRARVGHSAFPSTDAMLAWSDPDALTLPDHMILWSRIDYLIGRGDGSAGRLLRALKKTALGMNGIRAVEAGTASPFVKPFSEALASSPMEFDEAWAAWVKKTYPKR